MKINDEYIVKIEKMLFGGSAIARVDDFPLFIDGVCPDDKVKVSIKKINKNYAIAELIEIIEESKYRVKPICSLHNVCGSCDWQYIEYNEQLKQKQNIIKETLSKIAGYYGEVLETIPSPKIHEYRCKVQSPVAQTRVSKRILSGYYKKNSHELINIKYCPMQPNIINELNEFIKDKAQELGLTGYNEKNHSGLLRHFVYRLSSDYSQILTILVVNTEKETKELNQLAKKIQLKFPQVVGVCLNFNTARTNVILGMKTIPIIGNDYYIENLSGIKYKVSANSFFQVNPLCAEKIFGIVKKLISERINNPTILDAYSGVSSFGVWLSSIASKITSIEEVVSASNDAKFNLEINNINNLEVINGDAAIEFKKLIDKGVKFDVSVTDPPRKGCSDESINNLIALTKKFIVYVSCNVSTLARDMKILNDNGFKTVYVRGADMFPNTYHVETIVLFEKIYA